MAPSSSGPSMLKVWKTLFLGSRTSGLRCILALGAAAIVMTLALFGTSSEVAESGRVEGPPVENIAFPARNSAPALAPASLERAKSDAPGKSSPDLGSEDAKEGTAPEPPQEASTAAAKKPSAQAAASIATELEGLPAELAPEAAASEESMSALSKLLSPLVLPGAIGFAIGGSSDIALQVIEFLQDGAPPDEPFHRSRFPLFNELKWRRTGFACGWGAFAQALLLPAAFGSFDIVMAGLDRDLRFVLSLLFCTIFITPLALLGSYLSDMERAWLQGFTPALDILLEFRERCRDLPVHYLLPGAVWPVFFIINLTLIPLALRPGASILVGAVWHVAATCCLRRNVLQHLRLTSFSFEPSGAAPASAAFDPSLDPLGRGTGAFFNGQGYYVPNMPNGRWLTPSMAVRPPDFEAEHARAIKAMYEDLPDHILQENKPIVVTATVVSGHRQGYDLDGIASSTMLGQTAATRTAPGVDAAIAGGMEGGGSGMDMPPPLDQAQVQDACREAMLQSIRRSAPPIIQQFLESNIGLLNMGAGAGANVGSLPAGLPAGFPAGPPNSLPHPSQLGDAGLDPSVVPVMPTSMQTPDIEEAGEGSTANQDDEDSDEGPAMFGPGPGSYASIASILAKGHR